jgi:hypothetical protein
MLIIVCTRVRLNRTLVYAFSTTSNVVRDVKNCISVSHCGPRPDTSLRPFSISQKRAHGFHSQDNSIS